jgi:hypothetical protein
MDTAREQDPEIILELTVSHGHHQGLAIQIPLKREHWHMQRAPAWISQLHRHMLVPLAV